MEFISPGNKKNYKEAGVIPLNKTKATKAENIVSFEWKAVPLQQTEAKLAAKLAFLRFYEDKNIPIPHTYSHIYLTKWFPPEYCGIRIQVSLQ